AAEPERRQGGDGDGVLVEAGSQTDRVREGEAEGPHLEARIAQRVERAQARERAGVAARRCEAGHDQVMRPFRREPVHQGPNGAVRHAGIALQPSEVRAGRTSMRLGSVRGFMRAKYSTVSAMSSGWIFHASAPVTSRPPKPVATDPGMMVETRTPRSRRSNMIACEKPSSPNLLAL